jgi:hypothetical protein
MRKILFLLLITISSYGQTLPNPIYGTVTIKNSATVTSTPALTTTESTGLQKKIYPANLPISTATQTALDTKAIDSEVIHTTGNETKSGLLTLSDQLTFGEASGSPQELWKMPANSLLKYNNSTSTPQYGFDITSLGADSFFWVNEEGNSRQALLFADGDAVADSDIFGISASQDTGATYIKNFSITQAGKGYFRDALNALNYNIGTGYNVSLQPIRNQFASFFNQPFFTSDQGYSVFKPSGSNMPSRFYIMPNGTPTGTTSKFEMFNSDYSADYTTYNGFNILLNNTTQQIDIGSNRGSSGGARQKLRIGGDYAGSSFIANSSAIDMNTDNTINVNPFGGSVSIGTTTVDPFGISLTNQVTLKNPTTAQAIRLNLIGNGAAAGLYYGRDAIRTASIATQATTSDVEFSTNPTNAGTTLATNMRIWSATGNVSIQNGGSFTDNGNRLQITGNASGSLAASSATHFMRKGEFDTADGNNVKLTTNQTITGLKSYTDTGALTTALEAVKSKTSGNLVSIYTGNTSAGGILLDINTTTSNSASNVAKLLVLNAGSASLGTPLSVQNSGTDTFTVTKTGDVVVNTVTLNSVLKLKAYTVGTLPAGTVGDMAYVTDATVPTYNGTLTGGGAVKIPVFYDGTAWKAH